MPFTSTDICKLILAIFLPPLSVYLERGCNADFIINIFLTALAWFPGIIHGKPSSQNPLRSSWCEQEC
ncbi:hypothetical protein CYLTODRAFT_452189 [Cylindrobasidium torrendii FP15055 ss-10]|uniref:Uncharacterized protein n=1 Tax=Cylindrobasidium torrendii FP15055 ss-10 TaxID=1314674 RepID=A0A0D7BIN0_9AGAR|nr:hypothetical protein CYLTODRAFT_452189 [Cylindrobasidium torrendii FP15055 ss-10]